MYPQHNNKKRKEKNDQEKSLITVSLRLENKNSALQNLGANL
jgi:hypothetical protein